MLIVGSNNNNAKHYQFEEEDELYPKYLTFDSLLDKVQLQELLKAVHYGMFLSGLVVDIQSIKHEDLKSTSFSVDNEMKGHKTKY